MNWQELTLSFPFAQIVDSDVHYFATVTGGEGMQQLARDYGTQSANQTPRTVTVRTFTEWGGAGGWETYLVPVPPLENLTWNQGWPESGPVPVVDVLDDNTHYWAQNPEGWTLARAAADYGASYANPSQTPHEVQVREVSSAGNGEWQPFTVPVVEE